jgi:hypothetical protein
VMARTCIIGGSVHEPKICAHEELIQHHKHEVADILWLLR